MPALRNLRQIDTEFEVISYLVSWRLAWATWQDSESKIKSKKVNRGKGSVRKVLVMCCRI